jgi:hypothetical protein
MTDRNLIRASLRCAAMATFLVTVLGASCAGPPVYVFRRYPLSNRPDSTLLPPTLSVRGYSFSRSAPKKRHWWSSEPSRPTCAGFQSYRLDHLPIGIDRDGATTMQPSGLELLINRSASPALVIFYQYRLPQRTLDPSTADGAAQAAQMARQRATMDSAADELARQLVASAGMTGRIAAADTERTQSPEAMRDRCRAEVSRAR